MNDSRSLGPILRQYRIKNDILQKDMAARLKISGAQLSKLEMGHHEPLG
jgi:transcriptional regulator with XRE-family HTH domain